MTPALSGAGGSGMPQLHTFVTSFQGTNATNRHRLTRRAVLLGSLFLAAAPALGAHAAVPDGFEHFMQISSALTARRDLDPSVGMALFAALHKSDPTFGGRLKALTTQADAGSSDTATAKDILNAWYCGIVGTGAHAVCVTYVAALMNAAVADVLTPPTYAFGPYGSWAARPSAAG